MEPFENEELQQNPDAAEQPQAEPVSEPEVNTESTGYYHGVGAGQKESPFGSSPYVTYHPYQTRRSASTHMPPPSPARQPEKKQSHAGRNVFLSIVAVVLAIVLVVGSCCLTAVLTGSYWQRQWNAHYATILQNLSEKNNVLQQQIDALEEKVGENGGQLTDPKDTLTAGEIYRQNVNSVVALTCNVMVNSTAAVSAGTGFIITENGYIVTNHHVVDGASAIIATMADGTELPAVLVGSDSTNDVALIKVNATDLDPVTIGSSADVQVGDQVLAIGNALGELTSSLTVGYISGMDRNVNTDGTVINMLQTDVAINSGNSGGPLFNAKGEVIGITTAKYSGTTSSGASIEGISFAIPVDDVIGILEDLRDFGYVRSGYLGIYAQDVDAATAEFYGFPVGAYVHSTMPGSCAQKAGIQPKDIIVELGGYKITCMGDLSRALRQFEAGDTVTVKIWRGGQEVIVSVTLDDKPQS